MLTVETAAIWINGIVFTLPRPNRHHNIICWLSTLGVNANQMYQQGFVLSDGRFATRKEAYDIALKADQLLSMNTSGELFSEDIWLGGANMISPDKLAWIARVGLII